MLFAQKLYPTFTRIQRITEIYRCNLFNSLRNDQNIIPISRESGLTQFKTSLIFIIVYAMSMILQLAHSWEQTGLATKLESVFFIIFIALGGGLQVSLFPVRDVFAVLYKELIGFEKRYNESNWKPSTGKIYDAIVFAIVNLYLLSSLVVPVFGTLYFFLKPELNLNLEYFLQSPSNFVLISWKLFTVICNYRAWMVLAGACCFTVVNIFMVTGQCLKGYILLVKFMITEDSKWNQVRPKIYKTVLIYHEIQLMNTLFYITLRKNGQIIVFQLLASLVQIFSCYLIVTLNSALTLTQWMLVTLLGLDAIVFSSFVFGVGAKVYGASDDMIQYCRKNPLIQKDRWLKRFINGCQTLKIPFGLDGFLDRLTPLIFLNLNIQQTVNLILLN